MTAGTVCFSCRRKADNEFADVTLSGSMFQNCAAVTRNGRPPMGDSLNGGIRKRSIRQSGVLVDQTRLEDMSGH